MVNLSLDVYSVQTQLFLHITELQCFPPNSCSLALCLVQKTMATSLILESMGLMLFCLVRKPKITSKQSREVSSSTRGASGVKVDVENPRD